MVNITNLKNVNEIYEERYIAIGKITFSIPKNTPLVRNIKDFLRIKARKKYKAWYSMLIVPRTYGSRNGVKIAENTVGKYLFGVPGTRGAIKLRYNYADPVQAGMDTFEVEIKIPADSPVEAFAILKKIVDLYPTASITNKDIRKMKKKYEWRNKLYAKNISHIR